MTQRRLARAHDGIRTRDLFLTKEVLYRLSYVSRVSRAGSAGARNRAMPSCPDRGEHAVAEFPRGVQVPWSAGADLDEAGDETRTRDPQLGRLMLYQLSYTRAARPTGRSNSTKLAVGFEPTTCCLQGSCSTG